MKSALKNKGKNIHVLFTIFFYFSLVCIQRKYLAANLAVSLSALSENFDYPCDTQDIYFNSLPHNLDFKRL